MTRAKTQLTDIHFIYWVVFQLHHLSLLELLPLWPWELSQLALVFFGHASETVVGLILLCYEHSLTFWCYKMLQSLSLHLPLSHFLAQSLNQTLLVRVLVLHF